MGKRGGGCKNKRISLLLPSLVRLSLLQTKEGGPARASYSVFGISQRKDYVLCAMRGVVEMSIPGKETERTPGERVGGGVGVERTNEGKERERGTHLDFTLL